MPVDVTTKARVQAILASGGQKTAPLDALIPVLVEDVSMRFERFLGRGLLEEERTEIFDADPTVSRFFLSAYPVASIASIEYDADRAFGGAGEVLTTDEYALDAQRGIVILDVFPFSRFVPRSVEIVYTGGLGADPNAIVDAFPDLAHAADLQIAHLAKQRHSLGATSVAAGGGSVAFVGGYDLLPEVRATLESFRRRVTEG